MSSMRAVVVDPNAPGKLAIQSVDEPTPAPDAALVRVAAFSLNLGEVRQSMSAATGTRPGWDLAGTVEQAAADATGPPAGARVVGVVRSGAWAELVAAPTSALAELPAGATFAQAATLPVAGLTALHAVEHGTGLLARSVLVTGASGGVGHFACQLARLSGANVLGLIRRQEYAPLIEATGACPVVSEDGEDARQHGPYKLVVESVGGKVLANVLTMLAPDAVSVMFGASAGAQVEWSIWPFIGAGRASIYGLVMWQELVREPASIGLTRLARLLAEGRLKPHISVEASWTEVARVAQDLLDRRVPGKAVLHVR